MTGKTQTFSTNANLHEISFYFIYFFHFTIRSLRTSSKKLNDGLKFPRISKVTVYRFISVSSAY